MYPESESFKEALRQARERAAAVNRQRSQASAPDPPESGLTAARNQKGKAKERRGLMSPPTAASGRAAAQQPTPPQPDRVGDRAIAPGASVAAAMYPTLSMQNHLTGMQHEHTQAQVIGDSLLQRFQWRDLQARMAVRQEQLAALTHGMPGRAHWGAQAGLLPLSADDRWRMAIAQGLPPTFAAGRGALHPHSLVARGSLLGPQSQATPLEADNIDAAEVVPTKETTAGDDMMNMLAAAAEDTLRREEQQKAMESDEKVEEDTLPPDVTDAPATATKAAKRKRKAANEPKNPLGAFVFYQRKIMAEVFEENPCITFGEAAAECGRRWRELPDEEKMEYKNMAAADKERYTRELATFKSKKDDPFAPQPVVPKKEAPAKVLLGRKKKAGPEIEPKRARSAFQFYKADEIVRVKQEFPNVTTSEAATECSARYKALTKNQKEKYEKMAADDRARFKKEQGGDTPKKSEEKKIPAKPSSDPAKPSSDHPDPPDAPSDEDEVDEEEPKEAVKAIKLWAPPAEPMQTKIKYADMIDPNPYFVEETAWRYHNPPLPPSREAVKKEDQMQETPFPYVSHDELRPVPPPPPPPSNFPNTPFCRWSYDEDTRVLLADFRRPGGDVFVTREDEKYLLENFERNDITVVSEGLLSGLDSQKWTLDFLSRVSGDEYYHRFRRFDKNPSPKVAPTQTKKAKKSRAEGPNECETEEAEKREGGTHTEIDQCLSMKVADYVTYLRKRGSALAALSAVDPSGRADEKELCSYSFKDHKGEEITIDVTKTVLYMLDYDMVKLLPTLYEDFISCFKMRGALPGGSHCMMNSVTANARPFMGPNLYVTPPGSFTHFHQDGHGTVDSGHICLSGYNEVVMVRRLPERAKRHALSLLTGSYKSKKGPSFEGLYDLPHADLLGEKPQWPDNEAVAKCNEMNYCVSRFILKEGQCVHINKGRLHAFRKVTNEPLAADDCHAKLRANLMIPGTNEPLVGPGKPELLCVSVAWDWMFRGVTASGINREIVSTLECAALNRKYGAMSLAIPELSLIQMARTLAPKVEEKNSGNIKTVTAGRRRDSLIGFTNNPDKSVEQGKGFTPDSSVVCKGIFPALQYVVKQHIHAINVAESLKSKSFERCKRVSVAKNPNAWENPVNHPLDPYGNTDFFCKLCSKELSNVYLHCDGCEILLSKDFNICLDCHQEKRYAKPVQMHPLNNKRHSTINHIGNMQYDRASRCPCKNGPVCRHCNYCAGCSCRCHTFFTLNFRFFKRDDELKLLHRVKLEVGREELEAAEEAEKRLSMAVRGRFVDVGAGGPYGLHCMDFIADPELVHAFVEDVDESLSQDESEPGQERLSPIRKSRRILEEPSETPPDSDDIEKGNGGLDENGMRINVKDMKVTIRCQPGAFANGRGIDHIDLTTTAGNVEGGGTPDLRSREEEESSESDCTAADEEDVEDVESNSTTSSKVQVNESSDNDTDSEKSEALDKEGGGSLNDDTGDDKKPAAKTRINSGRWTDEERERLRIALINQPDMDSVVRAVGTRLFPAIRSYAPRTFPDLFEGLRERMQMNKPKGRRESLPNKKHDDGMEAAPARRSKSLEPQKSGPGRPTTRRRSRQASNTNSSEENEDSLPEVNREENNDDAESEEEGGDLADAEDSGKVNGRRPPPKARKNPLLASNPSGRSKRSTLDLSGGRKRRSGTLLPSKNPPVSEMDTTELGATELGAETEPASTPNVASEESPEPCPSEEAAPPFKRPKLEDTNKEAETSEQVASKPDHSWQTKVEVADQQDETSKSSCTDAVDPLSKCPKVEDTENPVGGVDQKDEGADQKEDKKSDADQEIQEAEQA